MDMLNKGINEVFKTKPIDPLTTLANFFLQHSENLPVLERIEAREVRVGEFAQTLEIVAICDFGGQKQELATHRLAYSTKAEFSLDEDGEGMTKAAQLIRTAVTKAMAHRSLPNPKTVDESLLQLKAEASELNLGLNVINVVSYGLAKAMARSKGTPLYKFISLAQRNSATYNESTRLPKLMLTCLRGGKAYNSKVKFARFMYIYEAGIGSCSAVKDLASLYATTRKNLAGGKLGEAGLKMISGSFICTMELINDALKVLEEAIKITKLPNVKIGMICNAGEVFNEATEKYEMEGAKALFDKSQMSDYYLKLLNEHPLISYLEDPMSEKDLPGWHLFCKRMRAEKPEVDVACNILINNNLKNIELHTTFKTLEGVSKEDPEYATKYEELNGSHFLPHVLCVDTLSLIHI
eukprot:TRINITY_DN602_c0_g1_i1.p1 TRINITY_DN602_c0_g1~~TRINITY_DN602_c0_g1_i1.p1  ORF type:complete len:432 (+),score=72.42 TRINITY_DN602_c0_g1_i1:71-1297(+)